MGFRSKTYRVKKDLWIIKNIHRFRWYYKYSKSYTDVHFKYVLQDYWTFVIEALMRGYPIEIPYVGIFKLFFIRHLKRKDFGDKRRSIMDQDISFVLRVVGPKFDKYGYKCLFNTVTKYKFYKRFGDTEHFYELIDKDEKNNNIQKYY